MRFHWAGALALVLLVGCASAPPQKSSVTVPRFGAVAARDAAGDAVSMATTVVSGAHVTHHIVSNTTGTTLGVFAEDAAHATADTGTLPLARVDASAGSTSTAGDYATLNVTTTGELRTTAVVTANALPTGAATETTLGTRLSEAEFELRVPLLGQAAMAASMPVTIASDQSAIAVSSATLDDLDVAEDSGFGSSLPMLRVASMREDTLSMTTSVTGDASPIKVDRYGATWIRNAPGEVTTILTAGDTSGTLGSSTYDATGCTEVWFEAEFLAGAATVSGDLYLWAAATSSITGSGITDSDRLLPLAADGSASPSMMNLGSTACTVPAGESYDGKIAVSAASANMPEICQFRVPRPPAFMLVRWDSVSGGSASDLTIRALCRAF